MPNTGEEFTHASQGSAPGVADQLMQSVRNLLNVPAEIAVSIRQETVDGATPSLQYYVLMTIAAMVAALGLVTNSTAVVIGAMLISPLMTPIGGVALGLAAGDLSLARRALLTEFLGVGLAVLAGIAVGLLPLYFKVTPEILARTHPTLLDLGVAALAGGAGCLAMLNPKLSPVLPGIAIATSLVPPLAASGLCFALGSPQGGLGAFLLFFANFLAILLVAGLLFLLSGVVRRWEAGTRRSLARRFMVAVVSLAVVCALLGRTLFTTISDERTLDRVRGVIKEQIAGEHSAALRELSIRKNKGTFDILATLRSAEAFLPSRVAEIASAIEAAVHSPVRLVVRSAIVRDVLPTGQLSAVVDDRIAGEIITDALDKDARRSAIAAQTLREVIDAYPGINLKSVELVSMDGAPAVLAGIESSRGIPAWLVGNIEQLVREKLNEPDITVVVRHNVLRGITRKGHILFGSAHLGDVAPETRATQRVIEQAAADAINSKPGFFAVNADAVLQESAWRVRLEVVGPRMLKPDEVAAVEKKLAPMTGGAQPVALQVWCRAELLVEHDGYSPKDDAGGTRNEEG